MSKFQELIGQNKYVTSLTWHPICEDLLTGGTYEGAIHFWKAEYNIIVYLNIVNLIQSIQSLKHILMIKMVNPKL